jgi:hypothetical protein
MRCFERVGRAVVAASLFILAACTGNGATCTAPPIAVATVVNPTLVSPASGSTGVSTGPLDVTIGSAAAAGSLYLKDAAGTVFNATNYRQANPPSNDAKIGTFTGLASQTTYSVYASVSTPAQPDLCGVHPAITVTAPRLLGSFTTG